MATRLDQARADLLAIVCEEIRTPLNDILAAAELLEFGKLDPKQRRFAEIIRQSGESVQTLADELLSLARIAAGKTTVERERLDLRSLISGAFEAVFPPDRAVPWSIQIAKEIPKIVLGDRARIRRVLVELIQHTIQFGVPKEMSVHARLVENRGSKYFVRVHLQGMGMANEEPIGDLGVAEIAPSKLNHNRSVSALAMMLIDAIGGRLDYSDERGASFTLTLAGVDSLSSDRSNQGRGPQENVLSSSPVRVLLAEDNAVNREIATLMLRTVGFEVDAVTNGREAVEYWDKGNYDLILMDCEMPEKNGFEAAVEIRKLEEIKSIDAGIPIVAVTAHALEYDEARCKASGMDDVLVKPFTLEQISLVSRMWLGASVPLNSRLRGQDL